MAAEQLDNVRLRFVNGANDDTIRDLLDHLLDHKVLNRGERDSVICENPTPKKKARHLIDVVIQKGDKASSIMIQQLKDVNGPLYDNLFQPSETDDEPSSSTSLSKTESLEKKKQKNEKIYSVTKESMKSRVALLITNIKFANEKLNRKGAEKDEENMEELLKSLKYEVVKFTNLTGLEIEKSLKDFSKLKKLRGTDSVFVVIMSHGKPNILLGVNHTDIENDEFPIDKIFELLGSQPCPSLVEKPKVIIIQACSGDHPGNVIAAISTRQRTNSNDVSQQRSDFGDNLVSDSSLQSTHKEKDFIKLMSSTPGTQSYRDEERGSAVIQQLVKVFKEHGHEDHIEKLFTKVKEGFEDFPQQMPTVERNSLTKPFYLFPRP
ncbi:caspase-1-like [Pholidichthys leucotaenia]